MAKRKKKTSASLWVIALAALLVMIFKDYYKSGDSSSDHRRQRVETTPEPREEKANIAKSSTESLSLDEKGRESTRIHDFDAAKGELRKLFSRGRDFYCDCSYDLTRKPNVDPGSCGLRSNAERAKRIEWEHVVPASFYGRQFTAWKKGDPSCRGRDKRGRECARKVSSEFRQIEGDLYNLVPAVGELNRVRGDSAYGEIPGEPREYGACDFETLAKVTEPRPQVRGDIARIYFYMDARYPEFGIVNKSNQTLLEEWARLDPMDDKERERLRKIEAVQGNSFFIGRVAKSEQAAAAKSKSL